MFARLSNFLFPKPTPEEMANAKEIADKIIAENKVAVFSKSYCRKCSIPLSLFSCCPLCRFVLSASSHPPE